MNGSRSVTSLVYEQNIQPKKQLLLLLLKQQKKEQIQELRKLQRKIHQDIRLMNSTTFSSIVSRAKYQIRLLDEGYSRGDSHRKHIRKRFVFLSKLDYQKGDRIFCDKCIQELKMDEYMFIHKRRSYNRFFHIECAKILNLI